MKTLLMTLQDAHRSLLHASVDCQTQRRSRSTASSCPLCIVRESTQLLSHSVTQGSTPTLSVADPASLLGLAELSDASKHCGIAHKLTQFCFVVFAATLPQHNLQQIPCSRQTTCFKPLYRVLLVDFTGTFRAHDKPLSQLSSSL